MNESNENSVRLIQIFNQAKLHPAGEQREEFLAKACAGEANLRADVDEVLRAHDAAGSFLEPPGAGALDLEAEFARFKPEEAGDRIGHYKLLQQIGEGGFGTVWVAEQEKPVRRRVALKIIKLGMDTKEVIARFEQERQAVALMDHPNIAKVFDAGTTGTGRPYFVMELVRGIKITEYCDQANLSTTERLQLFIAVCQAVQHAHQKGIIHRDLKPSNILVTLHDGVPVPKVIDFGVAKATQQQRLTERTVYTQFEQMIGTPAYMSPEQAEMSGLDVDTRSDIYSLGVLLYELLTGRTPFDPRELMSRGLDEIRRAIREQEPKKPSTAVATMAADARTTVARHRHADAAKLVGIIRGDLDWIVMKCMEKDRTRRYDTANSLAADLQRHLGNQPIAARPPSRAYQLQKFVRRNKLAVSSAIAVLLALLAGIVVSTFQAIRANRNSDEAQLQAGRASQFAALEKEQRQHADRQKALAEARARQLAHQLYASEMNVGFQSLEKGDVIRALAVLEAHTPRPGEEDLRGFEWYYLWRLCHAEQLELRGHHNRVRDVAFSQDGRLLATGGDDATARISDAQSGRELFVLRAHKGPVSAIAFSPDGKMLATGSYDHTVRLWDVSTGGEIAALPPQEHVVTAVAFGPHGDWLAAATGTPGYATGNPVTRFANIQPVPAIVALWDVKDHRQIAVCRGHTGGILGLAVSPDGRNLATGSMDRSVKLWDTRTGDLLSDLGRFDSPIFTVAFAPDGRSLAVGGGNPYSKISELKVLDFPAGRERLAIKSLGGPVFTSAFHPDGSTLAAAGLDQIVRLWDVDTGAERRVIRGHRAAVWSLSFDPAGTRLATASWDTTAKVWEVAPGRESNLFAEKTAYAVRFSPDGKLLASGKAGVVIHDVTDRSKQIVLADYAANDVSIGFTPDGAVLVTAGDDGLVTFWDAGTWRRLASLPGHRAKIWCMAISPDGRTVATGGEDRVVRFWDVNERREREVIDTGIGTISALAYTPDGRGLIVGSWTHLVQIDTQSGEVRTLSNEPSPRVALSPDGRLLAVVRSHFFGMSLLDLATGEVKWRIKPHADVIWSVQFSPDGKTIATNSWDGTAKLWNVASGQEMFACNILSVGWGQTFSPDGMTWAIGSSRGVTFLQRASDADQK